MIIGCGDPVQWKESRVPDLMSLGRARQQVEAYDLQCDGRAACLSGSSEIPWPHSRTYNHQQCIFPFMAIHEAYVMAMQAGSTLTYPTQLLISSSVSSVAATTSRISNKKVRGVCFSTEIEVFLCIENNEIEHVTRKNFSLEGLQEWKTKPWRLKPNQLTHEKVCHYPEQSGPYDSAAFHGRVYQQDIPDAFGNHNPLEEQPDFVQDLAQALQTRGTVGNQDAEQFFYIMTWFLHGQRHRVCHRPRQLRLDTNYMQWAERIRDAWQDRLQLGVETFCKIIKPNPPAQSGETHIAHVIIYQEPQQEERHGLISCVYGTGWDVFIHRVARCLPQHIHRQQCIVAADVPNDLLQHRIEVVYQGQHIRNHPYRPTALDDGASIVVYVLEPTPTRATERPATDDSPQQQPAQGRTVSRSRSPRRSGDETSLLAHRPQPMQPMLRISENSDVAEQEGAADIIDDAESSSSVSEPDIDIDSPSSSGQSYASDIQSHYMHMFRLNSPLISRRIRTDTWAQMHSGIRYELGLSRHDVQHIHPVHNRPLDLQAANTLVVIVHQPTDLQPGDNRKLVLLDIVFHEHHATETSTHRYAHALRGEITRRLILEDLRLQTFCQRARNKCIVKLNDQILGQNHHAPLTLQHGDYIRIDLSPLPGVDIPTRVVARCLRDGFPFRSIRRIYAEDDTDFEWATVQLSTDATALLQLGTQLGKSRRQTAGVVAHAQRPCFPDKPSTILLDQCIPQAPEVFVDFSTVAWADTALHQVPLDLMAQLPADLDLPQETLEELQTLQSITEHPAHKVSFYVDGSKIQRGAVGAGIVCVCETQHHKFLAGCMAKRVDGASHAFEGEHAAMTWALIWAVHISAWHCHKHAHLPLTFSFNFDAMNTGNQAKGTWRTQAHQQWKKLMRSLVHILQQRHSQHDLLWEHIKAHTNHPYNEFADRLAKYASRCPDEVAGCDSWQPWMDDDKQMTALQWIWYLERSQRTDVWDMPKFEGTILCHQLAAPTKCQMPVKSVKCQAQPQLPQHLVEVEFTIATANVLTLAEGPDRAIPHRTRQRLLFEQFHEAQCHVVCLQETRHKRITDRSNDHYHIIGHQATPAGQDGIQMWISKKLPFYKNGPIITPKQIFVIDSDSTYMITKLQMPRWRCIIVTGRAPHAGRPEHEGEQFWEIIAQKLSPYRHEWPIFFAGDTNGHVGNIVTDAIGEHGATKENLPGSCFHRWLLEHQLMAPSTFAAHHVADQQATYISPDSQHETRIDYVAVPQDLPYTSLQSSIDLNIDLSLNRTDHLVVKCLIAMTRTCTDHHRQRKIAMKYHQQELHCKLQEPSIQWQLIDRHPLPPWTLDPHISAELLTQQTQGFISEIAPPTAIKRRKHHISSQTWALVDAKKATFKQLKQMKRIRNHTMLHAIFLAWKGCDRSDEFNPWIKLHDHATALATQKLNKLSQLVTRAVKEEDAAFYQQLAEEAGRTYSQVGLTGLWKKLKAVLPKNKLKQSAMRYDIQDEMLRHFEQLEAGSTVHEDEVLQICHQNNRQDLAARPRTQFFDITEMPTLYEVEEMCLKQKPNKAPGPDGRPPEFFRISAPSIAPGLHNLMMKSVLSSVEPCRFKGGHLQAIWKQKGSPGDPSTYRGILLADSYAKIQHAWVRSKLLPTLMWRHARGQIGGLPAQQTATAMQVLRLHGGQARHRKLSTAVLFIDLKAAFLHLLRELVFIRRQSLTQEFLDQYTDPERL